MKVYRSGNLSSLLYRVEEGEVRVTLNSLNRLFVSDLPAVCSARIQVTRGKRAILSPDRQIWPPFAPLPFPLTAHNAKR